MITKSNSVIGKELINDSPFPITLLCLRTDKIKDTENKSFLSQFKTRSFEGFANIENLRFSISLNLGKI
ncbi:MAG: hypothetical protein WC584_04370 [Candidatus Pacearchaeota archaeon]